MKLTFMGAGSTVFSKNVIGDTMMCDEFHDMEVALYDINAERLEESYLLITKMNESINDGKATVRKYLGVEQRKDALRGADFVVNAIQVGLYDPCTIIDFEVPKKYGLRQTIADTLGIGGIFRGLRTIHVLKDFARDIEEVCPNAWFLNYTNPMAILSGYMQRYTNVKTVGLCHSVQVCSKELLKALGMEDKVEGRRELIAGINHMGWLLKIEDKDGNDLMLMDVVGVDDTMLSDLQDREDSVLVRRLVRECLTDREREIVTLRYGLGGRMPRTQREIAKKLGISRSYVSRRQ